MSRCWFPAHASRQPKCYVNHNLECARPNGFDSQANPLTPTVFTDKIHKSSGTWHCILRHGSCWSYSSSLSSESSESSRVILVVYYTDAAPVQFWLYLHRYWTDFDNFWCFVKLRPSSRRYADLEGILVHFDPPARTISIIANQKIHFHDLPYAVDIYQCYHWLGRYWSRTWWVSH